MGYFPPPAPVPPSIERVRSEAFEKSRYSQCLIKFGISFKRALSPGLKETDEVHVYVRSVASCLLEEKDTHGPGRRRIQ